MYLLLVDQDFVATEDLQDMMKTLPVAADLVNSYSAATLLKIAEKIKSIKNEKVTPSGTPA